MNYKDSENILLIICGAMGIALLSLIFRYLFLELGFDPFGANLVFIVIFVIGLIFYVSYLELLQKVGSRFFRGKERIKTESIDIEKVERIEEPKPNMDSIREEYRQKEQQRKEKLLADAIKYTQTTFAPYATDENISLLCIYINDYYNDFKFNKDYKSVVIKELSSGDLFHFGWNIWNHFKPVKNNKQEDIAAFLKVVFERSLKEVELQTIKKKLTYNIGEYKVKLEKISL